MYRTERGPMGRNTSNTPIDLGLRESRAARGARRAGIVEDRRGGSLLEVVIALVVLSFGMLGMATTTAMAVRQTTLAEITSRRVSASQQVAERLRSIPFDSMDSGSADIGKYGVTWSVTASSFRAKRVEIVTQGPMVGYGELRSTGASPIPPDTFSYTVVR